MLVEMRTYTIQPGHLGDYVEKYRQEAFPIQQRHAGQLLGYYTTDAATLNQVVAIRAFDDFDDRARRREALWADPAFKAAAAQLLPWIQHQDSRLLLPTSFSPAVNQPA